MFKKSDSNQGWKQFEQLEKQLKEKIFPDLEESRGGFDKIHTTEVVDWLKQIIDHTPDLQLDKNVMLIAAYAHDWGYSEIFKPGEVMDFEKVENAKSLHMEYGAKKVAKLLENGSFSFLTSGQKERIVHLVAVHDKKYEIEDIDELILMEADMLSSLQVGTSKGEYNAENNEKFMKAMRETRIPKFITKFGRAKAEELYKAREDYYK